MRRDQQRGRWTTAAAAIVALALLSGCSDDSGGAPDGSPPSDASSDRSEDGSSPGEASLPVDAARDGGDSVDSYIAELPSYTP